MSNKKVKIPGLTNSEYEILCVKNRVNYLNMSLNGKDAEFCSYRELSDAEVKIYQSFLDKKFGIGNCTPYAIREKTKLLVFSILKSPEMNLSLSRVFIKIPNDI